MMNPKYTAVIDDIRRQILHGRWQPRHRIPTRDALISQYNTSRATIQKAMDELLREGFICANGKGGTFVTDTPPNLTSIAVVFPASGSESGSWDALWSGFVGQKRYFEERFARTFVFYHLELGDVECPELRRLRDDAAGGKLAGIIMPFPPPEIMLAELRPYQVPLAAITRERQHEGLNTVWVDYDSFFRQSLEYLQSRNCKTAALIVNDRLPLDYIDNFVRMAAEYGILVPENLIQAGGLDNFAQPWITRMTRLMMQNRPDGLVVANENMIDAVINGLQQENLTVGRDISLAVHTNFPAQRPNGYDMQRIGFNIRSMLDACINALTVCRTGKRIMHHSLVPAELEDQVINKIK